MKGQNEIEDALDDLLVNVTNMTDYDNEVIQRLRAKLLVANLEIERLQSIIDQSHATE